MTVEAIDLTPSWRHNMAILILALEAGTPEGKRRARDELNQLARNLDAKLEAEPAAAPIGAAELDALGAAVQWAGHFATLAGDCQPNGPAFNAIRKATGILEPLGARIPHSRATRAAIDAIGERL